MALVQQHKRRYKLSQSYYEVICFHRILSNSYLSKYVGMKLPRCNETRKFNVIYAQNGSIYNISVKYLCCRNFAAGVRYFAFAQEVRTISDTTLEQWNVINVYITFSCNTKSYLISISITFELKFH